MSNLNLSLKEEFKVVAIRRNGTKFLVLDGNCKRYFSTLQEAKNVLHAQKYFAEQPLNVAGLGIEIEGNTSEFDVVDYKIMKRFVSDWEE